MSRNIVLVSFYNPKQIGVRYLEVSLKAAGFSPVVIALKGYNSRLPKQISEKELQLFEDEVKKLSPIFVGLSVNSSFNLEAVRIVQKKLSSMGVLTVWGGVFSTLMPNKAFECGADFVIAGEGEDAIVEFARVAEQKGNIYELPNLVYCKNGEIVRNALLPLKENADDYGLPEPRSENRLFIDNNKLYYSDPNLKAYGYEISATRGCPFECSYCSSVCLKRMYSGQMYVRHRSVEHILAELNAAKRELPRMRFVHFWDEIFPDDKAWIDEFAERYKTEIGLPFEVWGHPLKINEYTISKLVSAGLYEITVGIQSGSERVRREAFNRYEREEQILRASEVLSSCNVPNVVYDFMLRHPFETIEDLKQSYYLCMKLKWPFSLQLHGLGFLPGTDICDMAVSEGIYTKSQLDEMMFGSAENVYGAFWGNTKKSEEHDFWYRLIYLSQFQLYRKKTLKYAENYEKYKNRVRFQSKLSSIIEKLFYYKKKAKVYFRIAAR